MTIDEPAAAFKSMLSEAPENEKATHVHLFGIAHAEALAGMPLKEICIRAAQPVSYATEIRKGINLARHVELRER
jgi:hypothetical protein